MNVRYITIFLSAELRFPAGKTKNPSARMGSVVQMLVPGRAGQEAFLYREESSILFLSMDRIIPTTTPTILNRSS